MTEIVKRLLHPHKIERYLQGVADVEAPWSVAGGTSRDLWIESGPDGIALDATNCDDVLIEYELWDGEPPASNWDESRSGSIYLTSGTICAISSYSGESDHYEEFDLGRRDHEWQFRVHRKLLSHENFTADIIRFTLFKLQFWSPAEAVPSSPEAGSGHPQ
ncbi:hypothetical protein [Acrocarpospora catenulata]|uniref:hypothetical protein n=1 Tax=Acrocarpospora catenulata TaxID=2836182 RepID=UPI001BDB1D40|nr:hypothetical protein [Acrocarpospora catenulata]